MEPDRGRCTIGLIPNSPLNVREDMMRLNLGLQTPLDEKRTLDSTQPCSKTLRQEFAAQIKLLVACGWLADDEARSDKLRIELLSSSHALYKVITPHGRAVAIKQSQASINGRDLAREFYVYRLSNWIEEIADILPTPIIIDERRQTLVIDFLFNDSLVANHGSGLANTQVSQQLGQKMAKWHRATSKVALLPALSIGILHLPDALEIASATRPASTKKLMQMIAVDERLASILREAQSVYEDQCLIHGDIRCENWIFAHTGKQAQLKIIDWEISGAGDPAWDVGSVLAHAVIEAFRCGRLLFHSPNIMQVLEPLIHNFLRAYTDSDGLADLGNKTVCRHVVLFMVARLLHIACEWADCTSNLSDDTHILDIVGHCHTLIREQYETAETISLWSQF
jgi:thiamine kinase-like enzyme